MGAAAATQNGEVDAALIEQVICRRRVKRVADAGARVRCPESEADAGGYTPGCREFRLILTGHSWSSRYSTRRCRTGPLRNREVVGVEALVALPAKHFVKRLCVDILFARRQINAGLAIDLRLVRRSLQ